jgi:hypothetical protein
MMAEEATKRTRAKAEYVVERNNRTSPGWTCVPDAGPCFSGAAKALAWIKREGEQGEQYRVVRVVVQPLTVKITSVEKRTLT